MPRAKSFDQLYQVNQPISYANGRTPYSESDLVDQPNYREFQLPEQTSYIGWT